MFGLPVVVDAVLLATSPGQILTTLRGVATARAAAFTAPTLPIERFPTSEHLYSATGLAPASYESASIRRRAGIARTGLPEHRDALRRNAGAHWPRPQAMPELNARGSAHESLPHDGA